MEKWHKYGVIYQIYPQSFKDSNNDGIGDILGIIEKLDYLKYLGVDAIWIGPMYDSPNYDNGYDVRDYYQLQARYGTLEDFDLLVQEAHKRNIKIIMDLVANHTSHENKWFIESASSRDNKKSDWYIWRDPKPDGSAPTNWQAIFGGSCWTYCKERNQYYLHTFSPFQPDLNWQSEAMKKALFTMVNWWIKKGVDGFRLDAINFIAKEDFIDGETHGGKYANIYPFVANKPKAHEFLTELKTNCFDKFGSMAVGEASSASVSDAIKFSESLDMIFQFEHIALDIHPTIPWGSKKVDLVELKQVLNKWQTQMHGKAWNAIFWENHDQPRIVTRLGDEGVYREKSAKMLAVSMYFMEGTPFIYQGQEIGSINTRFNSVEEFKDLEIKNAFKEFVDSGLCSEKEMLERISRRSRDTGRTPMLWDASKYAGFSNAKPWIKVNDSYEKINVEEQMKRKDSCLNFYKQLLAVRKTLPVVFNGSFVLLDENNPNIFAYKRVDSESELIVICNYSHDEQEFMIDLSSVNKLILSNDNHSTFLQNKKLSPFEGIVLEVRK